MKPLQIIKHAPENVNQPTLSGQHIFLHKYRFG